MTLQLPDSWREALGPVATAPEMQALQGWLAAEEAAGKAIYPPAAQRLAALQLVAPEKAKVVILGQDPYHGAGQAIGLAFSVPRGVKLPPSLRNIYKELDADLGIAPATHGDLTGWARQGVLLLNTSLTVEEGKAGSHSGRGWEALTDAALRAVAERAEPAVFVLWGAHAQAKAKAVAALGESSRHHVLSAPHPSPLSAHRGFFGSRPFSQANAFLASHGRGKVNWQL